TNQTHLCQQTCTFLLGCPAFMQAALSDLRQKTGTLRATLAVSYLTQMPGWQQPLPSEHPWSHEWRRPGCNLTGQAPQTKASCHPKTYILGISLAHWTIPVRDDSDVCPQRFRSERITHHDDSFQSSLQVAGRYSCRLTADRQRLQTIPFPDQRDAAANTCGRTGAP